MRFFPVARTKRDCAEDADRIFGRTVESFGRWDGSRYVTLVVFDTGDDRITAQFVENLLVRYTVMSK